MAESLVSLLQEPIATMPAWIGHGVLPKGGILLFGGLSKIGKSWLTLEIIRAIATGTPVFDDPRLPTERAKVLLVEQENGRQELKKRAALVFARHNYEEFNDTVDYISMDPDVQLDKIAGINRLTRYMDISKPSILVLDPIGKFHGFDENSATDIGKLFNTFIYLRERYQHHGLSIVLAHHFGKPRYDYKGGTIGDPLDPHNFRGSGRWYSDPDTIVTCQRLSNLPTPWESWPIDTRWTSRRDTAIGDVGLLFNRLDDRRIELAPPRKGPKTL